ncbi:hypothetical protein DICA2_C04390 [Diutina catenulata]
MCSRPKLPSFEQLLQSSHPAGLLDPSTALPGVPSLSSATLSVVHSGSSASVTPSLSQPVFEVSEHLRDQVADTKMFCDNYLRKFQHILQDSWEKQRCNDLAMGEVSSYFLQSFTVGELERAQTTLAKLQATLETFKTGYVDRADHSPGAISRSAPPSVPVSVPYPLPRKRSSQDIEVSSPLSFKVPRSSPQLPEGLSPGYKQHMECQHCGSRDTPEWRRGPEGPRSVCNACGLFFSKLIRRYGINEAISMMRTRKLNGQDHDRRVY